MFKTFEGTTSLNQWSLWEALANEHMSVGDKVVFRASNGAVYHEEAMGYEVLVPNVLLQVAKPFVVELEGRPACRTIITVNPAEKPEEYDEEYFYAQNSIPYPCSTIVRGKEYDESKNAYVDVEYRLLVEPNGNHGSKLSIVKIGPYAGMYDVPLYRSVNVCVGETKLTEIQEWEFAVSAHIIDGIYLVHERKAYLMRSALQVMDKANKKTILYFSATQINTGNCASVVKMVFDGMPYAYEAHKAVLESVEPISGMLVADQDNQYLMTVSESGVNVTKIE